MNRIDWLKKKHAEIDKIVQDLEDQRITIRSMEHKAVLQDLKKQKLAIKTELEIELNSQL